MTRTRSAGAYQHDGLIGARDNRVSPRGTLLIVSRRGRSIRYLRKLAERRGARDTRLDEFRWWLEELRVGLFAQELKTPQPVSVKRLDKIWAQAFA